jgi:predicted DNA-binding transcriptional regulator AlpA
MSSEEPDIDTPQARLINMIRETKMTRMELSIYLGVSERTIYRWMMGDTAFPRMVFLALELLKVAR